jgi:hypothetical protein
LPGLRWLLNEMIRDMSTKYLYEQIVLKGALKEMLIAPAVRNTLDDRVAIALRSLQFTDVHTPEDFRSK